MPELVKHHDSRWDVVFDDGSVGAIEFPSPGVTPGEWWVVVIGHHERMGPDRIAGKFPCDPDPASESFASALASAHALAFDIYEEFG